MDVVDQETFIPAQSNGQPVAGDFELAVDFEHLRNPDSGPDIETLIKETTTSRGRDQPVLFARQ